MDRLLSRPHFVIIGAMKCATSTLHDQLAGVPGVFMTTPKEPCFFSDDEVWGRGLDWYEGLFSGAGAGDLCGESSTHYTKLPTHPLAAERMHRHLPDARLIYVMRDPIDRLVSHYIHGWSRREISVGIDDAVIQHPELIAYSSYARQIGPWAERYGFGRILPVFFERLTREPAAEFVRIAEFLGLRAGDAVWSPDLEAKNRSSSRLRLSAGLERVIDVPVLRTARRKLLPESVRERIKSRWRMRERPVLSQASMDRCVGLLDPEMARLGDMVGMRLSCADFKDRVLACDGAPEWVEGSA